MPQEYDPNGADPHAGGAKMDGGKPLAWLMLRSFSLALHEVIGVTTYGAEKYTPEGWAQVPNGENRYMEAGCRHLMAHARGEHTDPQTGFPHRAHAIWNLLCALELELRTKEVKRQAEEVCAHLGIMPKQFTVPPDYPGFTSSAHHV
jgi:hypothetical protein